MKDYRYVYLSERYQNKETLSRQYVSGDEQESSQICQKEIMLNQWFSFVMGNIFVHGTETALIAY